MRTFTFRTHHQETDVLVRRRKLKRKYAEKWHKLGTIQEIQESQETFVRRCYGLPGQGSKEFLFYLYLKCYCRIKMLTKLIYPWTGKNPVIHLYSILIVQQKNRVKNKYEWNSLLLPYSRSGSVIEIILLNVYFYQANWSYN